MRLAIDTNVLVRFVIRDDDRQHQEAVALISHALASGTPVLVVLSVALETEWVLRSRYALDKPAISGLFVALLESREIEFEDMALIEETLAMWTQVPTSDFADCLHVASAQRAGRSSLATFDQRAARLPGAELVSSRLARRAS